MTDAFQVVHVAWGASRADSVRDALRLQGCGDPAIGLTHVLSVGPIDPLDVAARRSWFAANTRSDEEADPESFDPEVPWTEATAPDVYPVYWVCLTDAGEHACFLEFVSRMTGRPFDIVDVTGFDPSGVSRGSTVWSLGQVRPEEIVAADLGGRRRPFTRLESDAAMAAWSRLKQENAPMRVVRNGRLVSAPLTQFDGILTGQASSEWELLIRLVARVLRHLDTRMDHPGRGCGYELLYARIFVLEAAGALEIAGPGPGMRDYEVRRPAVRQARPPTGAHP